MARTPYTKEEDEIMINFYESMTVNELKEILPNRCKDSIRYRVNWLIKKGRIEQGKIKKFDNAWSEEEENKLIKLYDNTTIREIGEKFENRSISSIKQKITHLINRGEIEQMKTKEIWSEKAEQFLIDNFMTMRPIEISKALNIEPEKVSSKSIYLRKIGVLESKPHQKKIEVIPVKKRRIEENNNFYDRQYKQAMKENKKNRDYGIGRKTLDFKFGKDKTYLLNIRLSEKNTKTFKGKLVQATHNHITFINNKNVRESFLKNDFLLGEIKVKEIA